MRERCIRGRGNRGFIAMLRGLLGECGRRKSAVLSLVVWGDVRYACMRVL